MPWQSEDSKRHTKKAKSKKRRKQWAIVANSVLKRTGDEGAAVRAANGVVKKTEQKHTIKHSGRSASNRHKTKRKTHRKKAVSKQ